MTGQVQLATYLLGYSFQPATAETSGDLQDPRMYSASRMALQAAEGPCKLMHFRQATLFLLMLFLWMYILLNDSGSCPLLSLVVLY